MERLNRKSSKTAQIIESQKNTSSNSNKISNVNTSASSNAISSISNSSEENPSETSDYASPFSFFYSMLPREILGIPVAEIKKDISDMSQLTSM